MYIIYNIYTHLYIYQIPEYAYVHAIYPMQKKTYVY